MSTPTEPHSPGEGPSARLTNGAIEREKWAAKWTHVDDEVMFDILLDAKDRGEINQNGYFKLQIWQEVADAVSRSTTVGGRKDVENCKSRWQRLKKDYKIVNWIKDQPGFAWDADRCVLLATDADWDIWVEAHPEHRRFRFYRFPQYDAVATLTDDELPPGHEPVRPRARMQYTGTGLTNPTFTAFTVPPVPGPSTVQHPPHLDPRLAQPHEIVPEYHAPPPPSSRPRKRPRQRSPSVESTTAEWASPLAEAVWGLKDSLDDYIDTLNYTRDNGVNPQKRSRHRKATAITILLEAELDMSDEDKARVIHVFRRDASAADAYMQIAEQSNDGVRKKWLEQLLKT